MKRRKVLYVLHNHPRARPGGAELYALELYSAMRESATFEPFLLARAETRAPRMTALAPATTDDPRQYLIYTDSRHFDHLRGTSSRESFYTRDVRRFLDALKPEVLHFQHTLFLGYPIVSEVRRTLPSTAIVYTLHDFHPICHRDGQMVRTPANELCHKASPQRCHECFPDVSPEAFAGRERFIQQHLDRVDLFIAPSRFLRDRYVAWGVPAEKILVEDYGRLPSDRLPYERRDDLRNRLAFFGQITPFKGVDVLLEAMKLLKGQNLNVHLRIHGANIELADREYRERVEALLSDTSDVVTLVGPYEQSELPRLMAEIDWVVVPSIWWENSPLVIQEAFAHGRPVICSDIGGMAEKVEHGVNGIHFRARDAASLAEVVRRAVGSPELWARLARATEPPPAMVDHAETLAGAYARALHVRGELAPVSASRPQVAV